MKEISGSTWIIIILFVVFVIIINVWLLTYAKEKKTKRTGMIILRDSMNVLKNPFQEEDKKLEELANLTTRFKEKDYDTQKGDRNAK